MSDVHEYEVDSFRNMVAEFSADLRLIHTGVPVESFLTEWHRRRLHRWGVTRIIHAGKGGSTTILTDRALDVLRNLGEDV